MKSAAVLLAAGSGRRMGSGEKKQYLDLCGRPLMYYSLSTFAKSAVDDLIIVVSPGDAQRVREEVVEKYGIDRVRAIVDGGAERYDSVGNGVRAAHDADLILIHDTARPFVTVDMIDRAMKAASEHRAAVVGMPVKDTVRITDEAGVSVNTPDRRRVWAAQTPQVFEGELVRRAYDMLSADRDGSVRGDVLITDDAQVVELYTGVHARMVEGSWSNMKVTVPEDVPVAESILAGL